MRIELTKSQLKELKEKRILSTNDFEIEILDDWKKFEYLNGDGNWKSNKEYFANYRRNLKKLTYNFGGIYLYYISETPSGFDVIWRTKWKE